VACAADAKLGGEGCRVAGVAPRGCGAATPGCPAAGRLGRPGGAGWPGAAAATSSLAGLVRAAGDAAALASRPGAAPLDLPAPAWSAAPGERVARAGVATGQGEPDLGVSPHPRRAVPPRLQGQDRGQHRVDNPAARRRSSGTGDRRSPGGSSCGPRPAVCWPWTSSPWTQSCWSGCTYCL
jgi:hypothetical protein